MKPWLSLKHFVKRSVSSSSETYSHSNTLCNSSSLKTYSYDHFPLPSKPTLTQTLCVMLRFLFLQNLFSLKHFVQRSVSSSSKTYFHSNALWNTQFSLPPKPILTPSQTLCEMLTCLFLQNLLSLKHFVKRSLSSSFKAYSHSNTLWNAHFPLAPKPTLTQTLCETLTFLFLQSLLSLKHFVKRSLSSCSKAYSHSNALWNAQFPLASKPTLTQTLWETLTFLLLQSLIEV